MTEQQRKVSILLTGSRDDQTTEELRGPLLEQNGSPNLSESRNTRLSIERGTCTRAPDVQPLGTQLTSGAAAYGIVGNNRKRNYALFALPSQGNRVVGEDGYEARATGEIRAPWTGYVGQQSLYLPMHISSAGQLPGPCTGVGMDPPIIPGIATCYNATKDELWCAWTELQDVLSGDVITWVSCYAGDGTQLAVPSVVGVESTGRPAIRMVGLTAHGANGVRLWYGAGTGTAGTETYRYKPLTLVGNMPNAGTAVIIPRTSVIPQLWSRFSVTSQDSQYAYLSAQGADGNPAVLKVDVNAGTVTRSVSVPGGSLDLSSVYCMNVAGVYRVSAAFGTPEGATGAVFNDQLGYVVPATAIGTGQVSAVAAKFSLLPVQGNSAMWAASFIASDTAAGLTVIRLAQLDGSTIHTAPPLYWTRIYDHGAQWDVSATESYPLLSLSRDYFWMVPGMTPLLLLDPSIEVYLISRWQGTQTALASPVARMGCVRGTMSPAAVGDYARMQTTTSVPRVGSDLFFTYRKEDDYFSARFVRLSTVPEQPAVAHDRDGVAIVAAALPVQWDGVDALAYGDPLHAPQLVVQYATSSPPLYDTPPAGNYGFCAVFEWVDGAGLAHRSMPSVTQSVYFDGTQKVGLKALAHDTMHVSWAVNDLACVVYRTGADGTAYEKYAIDYTPTSGFYDSFQRYSGKDEIVYSRGLAGEELVPQPPPPLRDVAIIGSRCWGIDAEVPSRIVYSKLRVAGIGFEFNPALEVIAPSAAGDVIAVRESQGSIILFAERGIFQVSDGGPNNMGQGGSFGSPYRISEAGTRSRRSVIGTPQGILFLDNTGCYSLLAGGSIVQLPGASFLGAVTGGYLMEDGEEAVIVENNSARVFNYGHKRWTMWDLPAAPSLCAQSAISLDTGLLYAPSSGRTYTHDSRVLHPTALMRWETDWILFGGDFQDYCVAYEVLFNAYIVSDHALRLELLTEYNGAVATTLREWTAAELNAIALGPLKRYTVKIESVRQDARAFKLRVQELTNTGTHRGMRPGAVTVVYSVDGLTYEEAIIPGSLK